MEYSSGHFVAEDFGRAIFKPLFDADLRTLRGWRTYTSNPTTIQGDGPLRTLPPSFLARNFQEMLILQARYVNLRVCLLLVFIVNVFSRAVLKDIVAPVISAAVMEESDFALNQ
jgi:hypothetical protein